MFLKRCLMGFTLMGALHASDLKSEVGDLQKSFKVTTYSFMLEKDVQVGLEDSLKALVGENPENKAETDKTFRQWLKEVFPLLEMSEALEKGRAFVQKITTLPYTVDINDTEAFQSVCLAMHKRYMQHQQNYSKAKQNYTMAPYMPGNKILQLLAQKEALDYLIPASIFMVTYECIVHELKAKIQDLLKNNLSEEEKKPWLTFVTLYNQQAEQALVTIAPWEQVNKVFTDLTSNKEQLTDLQGAWAQIVGKKVQQTDVQKLLELVLKQVNLKVEDNPLWDMLAPDYVEACILKK